MARRLGFGEAFDYAHPADIFVEHARLSGFENEGDGRRCFDISALAELDRQGYDTLAPIQWPVTRQAPRGTPRLFEDGHFATPDGRARLVPVSPHGPVQALGEHRRFRLNTGRVRDQWHTMTRTARAPRLMNHRSEPFIEVHPEDARELGLTDQGWRDSRARVVTTGGGFASRRRSGAANCSYPSTGAIVSAPRRWPVHCWRRMSIRCPVSPSRSTAPWPWRHYPAPGRPPWWSPPISTWRAGVPGDRLLGADSHGPCRTLATGRRPCCRRARLAGLAGRDPAGGGLAVVR